MKLSPNQQQIVSYLEDGRWHCMANPEFFMKDDRKRCSELNAIGFEIIGMKCDKSCGIKHSSRVFMRKMKARPDKTMPGKAEPVLVFREGRPFRVYPV